MTKQTLKNTIILGFSGFCAKGFDFIFRAYYARILGQEGMGILSLGFGIHGVMLTVSTAGLGVAIAKVVSEFYVKKEHDAILKSMNIALRSVILLSSIVMICIFIFAEWIAKNILKEPRVSTGLSCLAPSIMFMGISYCLKGYFYAKRKVVAPALSEFLEQVVKGILIYLFLIIMLPKGIGYGCSGVFLGITLGELSSCLFLCFCFLKDIKIHRGSSCEINVGMELFKISFPAMVSSFTGSILRMQEEVWIISSLKRFGMYHSEAVSNLGIIHGMIMPMLVFPLTLIGSISTLLVPEISRANALAEKKRLYSIIKKIYLFGSIVGLSIMMLFYLFTDEIAWVVYRDLSIAPMVRKLSIICPLIFLDSLSCSMLSGLGKQVSLLCYSLLDSFIRLVGIYFLVSSFGINGMVWVILFSNVFTCFLTVTTVLKSGRYSYRYQI